MKKQEQYNLPGFPITEAKLLRKVKGKVSRQTLWIYRKDKVFKEGEDWIKVGSNVFYSEAVVQKIIKSTK